MKKFENRGKRMKKRVITIMSFDLIACGADNNKEIATEEVVIESESEVQKIVEQTELIQETENTEATEEVATEEMTV